MKLPEQWAPLKLNLLLGIVALQFTFASIAFIVRFKHHPPSRYQMAETNVRAGPSPPLSPSLSLLLQHRLIGRRAKLGQMGVFCISLYGTATAKQARMIASPVTVVSQPIVSCLFRGCLNRAHF